MSTRPGNQLVTRDNAMNAMPCAADYGLAMARASSPPIALLELVETMPNGQLVKPGGKPRAAIELACLL